MVKGVIFDMDGTMVDNILFHRDAWIQFLKEHHIHIEAADFHAQNHGTIQEMIGRFFGELSAEAIDELGYKKELTYRELYKEHLKEVKGLTKLLTELSQSNIRIGLATMSDKNNIDFILDSLKVRHYFDCITGGDDIKKGKPDPEVFLKTLQKLQLENKDCVVIEDSLGGINAALQAGIQVIGITTTQPKKELIDSGCYAVINDFTDFKTTMLPELLK